MPTSCACIGSSEVVSVSTAVNIAALLGRARAGTEVANWEQALADTNLVLAVQPENATALSIRGYVTAITGTETEGLADLQAAKIADPTSTDPYNYLALYYLSQRKLDEALIELNASLELDPEQPLTLNSRSVVYYYKEDIAHSLGDLDAAIALNPQSAFLLTNRAALARSNSNLQSSLSDLNQAVAAQPLFALAYLQRAFTYIELAKADAVQARPYYEVAISDLDAYMRLENPDDAFSGIAEYRANLVTILAALP